MLSVSSKNNTSIINRKLSCKGLKYSKSKSRSVIKITVRYYCLYTKLLIIIILLLYYYII